MPREPAFRPEVSSPARKASAAESMENGVDTAILTVLCFSTGTINITLIIMKMNLRQIEVFRAIMLTGSISGASKLLFVSQPAISRLMAHTEQRLGLTLFVRAKGRLHPTPEARRLLGEVNAVYDGVERVNGVAEDLMANRTGSADVPRRAC